MRFHEILSGPHFFHQDPWWDPKGQPKGPKRKMLDMYQNPINFFFGFYEVFPGPHFFHKDPGWNPKGQPKGPKRKMLDRQKNPSKFLSYFMRSLQDTTFSTRIQDGILRDSQRDKKGTCLTSGKTLASVYLISWGRLRTLLFPPGSRMGSQGATKGTKQENAWRVEKP